MLLDEAGRAPLFGEVCGDVEVPTGADDDALVADLVRMPRDDRDEPRSGRLRAAGRCRSGLGPGHVRVTRMKDAGRKMQDAILSSALNLVTFVTQSVPDDDVSSEMPCR